MRLSTSKPKSCRSEEEDALPFDPHISDPIGNGPQHVAIIMDGNGRWAQARGRPRLYGHHAGARRVREVVEAAGQVTNRPVPVTEGPRRAGDCTKLVSGSSRAAEELGWEPTRSTLAEMIGDAWRWHREGHYEA